MRSCPSVLFIYAALPLVAFAQEGSNASVDPSAQRGKPESFLVELTEIENCEPLRPESEPSLVAEQLIREAKKNGTNRRRNIVRLSALEGIQSYAQFGSRIPVVVGKTTSKNGTEFDYIDENVGTEIRVTVHRLDVARLRVKLSFASSHLNLRADGTKESVDVVIADSIRVVEVGRPVLLHANLKGKSSVLILSLEPTEQN